MQIVNSHLSIVDGKQSILNTMQLPAQTDNSTSASHGKLTGFALVSGEMERVRKLINKQLTAAATAMPLLGLISNVHRPEDISQLLEYISERSGKMIRPGMVLLCGAGCGKITDEHIKVAAVIEMIHHATLLHDDVMDDGRKRRGRPTVNSLFGNEAAVLLGDYLLSQVFRMSAELDSKVAGIIATAAVRLCEGELRQVIQRHNWKMSESEYIEVITEKSAVLFSSACYLGGSLAGGRDDKTRSLAEFGLNAGIAFQITDDLLDIVGDEKKTGKTLGTDVEKHKLTLSVIHLLKAANQKEKTEIIDSYLESKDARCDKTALIKMLDRYGSLEYARTRAKEYVATAIKALDVLKPGDAKDALAETAEFVAGRVT